MKSLSELNKPFNYAINHTQKQIRRNRRWKLVTRIIWFINSMLVGGIVIFYILAWRSPEFVQWLQN